MELSGLCFIGSKRGNASVKAGDYSTYNGLKIGLLERHTYNDKFLAFTKEKGFECEIVYYKTPTELSNALIKGEVDALVDSYIRTPEDETTIEDFGETPYYFMARKEDQALIDSLDAAIDRMSIETPNWRSDMYNKYYGSQDSKTELTADETALLEQMLQNKTRIKAVMKPEMYPYSWYEDGKARGIIAELFTETAKELGIDYEIVPVSTREEYNQLLADGKVDIWMDMDGYYEDEEESKYKETDAYLDTTVSVIHRRGSSGKINTIGVTEDHIAVNEIISSIWPDAEIVKMESENACADAILKGRIDGALIMSYTVQMIARDDVQNRFSVDVVQGASLSLKMGVNADDDYNFYGMWNKTLKKVAANNSSELVQKYLEIENQVSFQAYMFDHPVYFVCIIVIICFILFIISLYIQSLRARNKQLRISEQLSEALDEANRANNAKVDFFSKMSHDIRTQMNAVLGMTQIAKKYKNNPQKLEDALENITSEGHYLLTMINSILDVNQLEHGHIELNNRPFDIAECLQDSMGILEPLAVKKQQTLSVSSTIKNRIVVGDSGKYSQIMINIVSNAVKYTNMGGKIQVSLDEVSENRYCFTCIDNGIGMSKEFVKHICEDYSRAEDCRISTSEGTGLGMAVVKGFTDLMNGSIDIKSEEGKGTEIAVELSFAAPTDEEKNLVTEQFESDANDHLDLTGKKSPSGGG